MGIPLHDDRDPFAPRGATLGEASQSADACLSSLLSLLLEARPLGAAPPAGSRPPLAPAPLARPPPPALHMPEPAAAPTDWPDLVDAEESSDDEGIPPLLPDSPTSPGPSLVYSWSWANSPRARNRHRSFASMLRDLRGPSGGDAAPSSGAAAPPPPPPQPKLEADLAAAASHVAALLAKHRAQLGAEHPRIGADLQAVAHQLQSLAAAVQAQPQPPA